VTGLLLAAFLAVSPAPPATYSELRSQPAPLQQTAGGGKPPWNGTDEEALAAVERWIDDPVAFVRDMFGAEPDAWQAQMLMALVTDERVGASACKGPGKTCGEAWAIWWFEYTRVDAQAIVTSITGDNLKDNLWKELSFWYSKSPALQRAFEVKGERIVHRERPRTWWVSARTWAQNADPSQQANSLAGFHGQHVLVVLDEMGDYPEGVVQAAEGIFANQHVAEARLLAAWNPTRTDGPAYRVCTKDRKRWTIIHITGDPEDPNRSPRISIEWARKMIEDWGRDSDVVRVNVLGLFPRASSDKLLSADDVQTAMGRAVGMGVSLSEASVWGLDVARSLTGDRSVLRERVGCAAMSAHVWRGKDGVQLANVVSHVLKQSSRQPDYLVVDVAGVGASAVDQLRVLGWGDILIPVDFGGGPDEDRFGCKRDEMWWRCADWVKRQGSLPPDSGVLAAELTAPTYRYGTSGKRTVFRVESKESLKDRGLDSPDEADSLVLTFHQAVWVKREMERELEYRHGDGAGRRVRSELDDERGGY
jgi:hypothetical protein